jgi:hypothetical protein
VQKLFTGKGDDVVDIGTGNDRIVVHAIHTGKRNFIVDALDSNLQSVGVGLVNEIGNFDGTVVMQLFSSSPADVRYLKVQADGAWSLELLDIRQLATVGETFNGHGSTVVVYTGTGGIFTIAHNGSRNFIVSVTTSDGNSDGSLINEIGTYNGRQPIPAGPALIEILADGDWTFVKN